MVYNTTANVRVACGMPAASPPDATIAYWQTLIDAMIDKYCPSPTTTIAAIIEINRLVQIWTNICKNPDLKTGNYDAISPLTDAEKDMLNTTETVTSLKRTKWWV